MNNAFVKFAVRLLKSTGMRQPELVGGNAPPNFVKVTSVRKLEQREDVYDLTVARHHNFAVNGGHIVKNCDSLRYGVATVIYSKRRFMSIENEKQEGIS